MPATEIRSVLTGTAGLSVLLAAAVCLTFLRPRLALDPEKRRSAVLLVLAAIAAQGLHFAEELGAGFFQRFPAVLGLPPWSRSFFVSFNLTWIAIWLFAAAGLRRRLVVALAPVWFLALASMANGVLHPLLALRDARYFPGLYTSPLLLVVGIALTHRLAELTRDPGTSTKERTSPGPRERCTS